MNGKWPGITGMGMEKEVEGEREREGKWRHGSAGMTFKSLGTGMENSIPEIREREGNKKIYSQNSGMGRE